MTFFLILTISAASYCGFFSIWGFGDFLPNASFTAMLDETAGRPFIHRQLLPQTVKIVASSIPEQTKTKLEERLRDGAYIENRYTQARIPQKYIIEYHLLYIFSFFALFASIWILRSFLSEIVQDKVAGTLGAMLFALIFPFFEVIGGYHYDIFEFFFMFMAAHFALHGKWIGLLLLAPFAEANKESFLFFLITLFPLASIHFSLKKATSVTLGTVFMAGITYLYIRQLYVANPGDMADWRIRDHLENMLNLSTYFHTTSIYGLPLGEGMFLPHIICVFWMAKKVWHHLTDAWKKHVKIALVINGILYFMFVVPNEIRDLSMLYVSLMILTTFFIRDIIQRYYENLVHQ